MSVGEHLVSYLPIGALTQPLAMECEVEDVTIHHGREDPTAQPEASTATFSLPLPVPHDLEVGSRIYADTTAPSGLVQRRFTGSVTDISITHDVRWDPEVGELVTVPVGVVLAAGPLAGLGRRVVGDAPWPQELDGARAARILSLLSAPPLSQWRYSGAAPDGWFDQYVGTPLCQAITADTDGLRLTWFPGATRPGGLAWRYMSGFVAGQTVQIVAEIWTQVPVYPLVLLQRNGPPVQPADGWQTVTLIWTPTSTADQAVGLAPVADPARPAGAYTKVRRFDVTRLDTLAVGVVDPGVVQVLSRDVDRQPALDLMEELADDAGAIAWQTADGLVSYADAEHRRGTPVAVTLDACDILMAPVWTRTLAGLVNDAALGYGLAPEGGEQPVAAATNAPSIDDFGRYAYSRPTQLAALADAQARVQMLVTRGGRPAWNITALPLDLSVLDDAKTEALLGLDMHDLLGVTGLPAGSPSTSDNLWVEGWNERLAYGVHELTLAVSAYCRTAPAPRWDDVAPTQTWDTIGDDTWDDATCFGPLPSFGRWADVPASLRWDQVNAATTWNTWPG